MAAVRLGTCLEPGKITVRFHVRPPTDVMAITSLPIATERLCLEVGPAILGRPRPSRDARPYPMQWASFSIQTSIQPSTLSSVQSSEIDSALPSLAPSGKTLLPHPL